MCALLGLSSLLLVACSAPPGAIEQAGRAVEPEISHQQLASITTGQQRYFKVNVAGLLGGNQVRLYLKPMYLSYYPYYLHLRMQKSNSYETWLPPFTSDCRGIDYLVHVSSEQQPALRSRPQRLLVQSGRTASQQQVPVVLHRTGPQNSDADSCMGQGVTYQPGETWNPLLAQEAVPPTAPAPPGRSGPRNGWLQKPGSLSISIDGGGSGFSWKSIGGN